MIRQNDLSGNHINKWLIDENYLSTLHAFDIVYLKILGEVLYTFLVKKCPVQVKTEFVNNSIRFRIGKEIQKDFPIDLSIHPDDYILWIEQWLRQYYPQYKCEVEKYIPYTEEEKTSIFLSTEQDNISKVMLSLDRGKKINVEEDMIITRIILLKDKFKVFIDGIPYSYSTRKIKLSQFLSEFRKIKDAKKKKEYFEQYTIKVKRIEEKPYYLIDRREDELLSFFKIYKNDKKVPSIAYAGNITEIGFVSTFNTTSEYYNWGKYVFKINSEYVNKVFLDTIQKLKEN